MDADAKAVDGEKKGMVAWALTQPPPGAPPELLSYRFARPSALVYSLRQPRALDPHAPPSVASFWSGFCSHSASLLPPPPPPLSNHTLSTPLLWDTRRAPKPGGRSRDAGSLPVVTASARLASVLEEKTVDEVVLQADGYGWLGWLGGGVLFLSRHGGLGSATILITRQAIAWDVLALQHDSLGSATILIVRQAIYLLSL